MRSEKQVPQSLEDHIRKVGAPLGLMSDYAKSEMHGKTKELLRMYDIDDYQSEPEYQHQNPAERGIQTVKRLMNGVMDRTGCEAHWWLLAALFVLSLVNHIPNSHGEVPITKITGQVPDVSKFMHFHFWQEVYVESHKPGRREELARWCYPADNCGDELTYMVLLTETNQLVPRSNVRSARDPLYPNLRQPVDPVSPPDASGEEDDDDVPAKAPAKPAITNLQDQFDAPVRLPKFSPEELIGLTFLHEIDNGQKVRAEIVKKVLDQDSDNHQRIKMLLSYDDGKVEEIISYNKLCDIVEQQHQMEESGEMDVFTFSDVLEHEGPLHSKSPNYKGSSYNVKVKWTDGSITWEPLALMVASDPVTLAAYAKEYELLELPGWKKLKKIARRAKVLMRMVNANKRVFTSLVCNFQGM